MLSVPRIPYESMNCHLQWTETGNNQKEWEHYQLWGPAFFDSSTSLSNKEVLPTFACAFVLLSEDWLAQRRQAGDRAWLSIRSGEILIIKGNSLNHCSCVFLCIWVLVQASSDLCWKATTSHQMFAVPLCQFENLRKRWCFCCLAIGNWKSKQFP